MPGDTLMLWLHWWADGDGPSFKVRGPQMSVCLRITQGTGQGFAEHRKALAQGHLLLLSASLKKLIQIL